MSEPTILGAPVVFVEPWSDPLPFDFFGLPRACRPVADQIIIAGIPLSDLTGYLPADPTTWTTAICAEAAERYRVEHGR